MNREYPSLLDDFTEDCELRNWTSESIRRYKSCLLIFSGFLNRKGVEFMDVQKHVLKDFLRYLRNERRVKPTTIENYFASINAFYEFLLDEGRVGVNIVPQFRKKYLNGYKKEDGKTNRRKIITPREMSEFLNSIMNPRDKAIATLLVKTGIRRGELSDIDLEDINWRTNALELKDKKKRSNTTVYFDNECAKILKQWIGIRDRMYVEEGNDALFLGQGGRRLGRHGIAVAIVNWAIKKGHYDTTSKENKDHFSPHNMRHCFTTYLLEHGMDREYVKELRGDARKDAVDIYNHISKEKLREAYLAAMPQFGL